MEQNNSSTQLYPFSLSSANTATTARNHLKTHFQQQLKQSQQHKINNFSNEIIETHNVQEESPYTYNMNNNINNNNHVNSFTSLPQQHKNKIFKSNTTNLYHQHNNNNNTRKISSSMHNHSACSTSDCNSSILGNVGSTKTQTPAAPLNYHEDYQIDDSFKLFYNGDLNFPLLVNNDHDSTRQKMVKNVYPSNSTQTNPHQIKTRFKLNNNTNGQATRSNTNLKDSSSSFIAIGKPTTYQQNRTVSNKEAFDNSLIIERLNKLNVPLNDSDVDDLNNFTIADDLHFHQESKNVKFYHDESHLNLSLPAATLTTHAKTNNNNNKLTKFIRSFKKKLKIANSELSLNGEHTSENDLSSQGGKKSSPKVSATQQQQQQQQKPSKQNRDIIGKIFKVYNRTFRKDLVTKMDSASSLNKSSNTIVNEVFPHQQHSKRSTHVKHDPNLFDYNMNLILSQVNDKFGRESPLARQTYENNYFLNSKAIEIQTKLNQPNSADTYLKYGSKQARSDENLNGSQRLSHANDYDTQSIHMRDTHEDTLNLSRSKSLNNTSQTPSSKKRVSFHEQVLRTDVESGNSELIPIYYDMKEKISRLSSHQQPQQQQQQQQQQAKISNRNQINISQNTSLVGPFYEIPIKINRVNLAPTEITYPLTHEGHYEMINFNATNNQTFSAYDNFDTNHKTKPIEHI